MVFDQFPDDFSMALALVERALSSQLSIGIKYLHLSMKNTLVVKSDFFYLAICEKGKAHSMGDDRRLPFFDPWRIFWNFDQVHLIFNLAVTIKEDLLHRDLIRSANLFVKKNPLRQPLIVTFYDLRAPMRLP